MIACFIEWFSWKAQTSFKYTLELMFVCLLEKIQVFKKDPVQFPGPGIHFVSYDLMPNNLKKNKPKDNIKMRHTYPELQD